MSLRHRFGPDRWGGRIEAGQAQGGEYRGRSSRAAGNGAFGLAAPEGEVDDPHGAEDLERFGSRQVEPGRFELLFEDAVEQEGERGDEDVRLDAGVGAVVDRAQFDDVLEIGEGALDLAELFVDLDGLDRGEVRLLGLDD